MKRLLTLLPGLLLMVSVGWGQGPAAITLVQWNFNAASQTPSTGNGGLVLVGGVGFDSYAGQSGTIGASSDPDPAGLALETSPYPADGTADRTAGVEIQFSGTGYKNFRFSFDLRHAGTASRRAQVQYSVNGGSFQNLETYEAGSGDTWVNKSVDMSAITALTDATNIQFRIVSAFANAGNTAYLPADPGSAYSPAGSWRFDMLTVTATPLTPLNAPGDLIAGAGSSAGTVSLHWTDNSSNEDNFVLERSPTGTDPWTLLSATIPINTTTYSTTPPDNAPYYYRVKAVNVVGSSGYAQTTYTLPVTWLGFSARYVGGQVVVSWATATEQDNAYFAVERSSDAVTYRAIGQVTGKGMSDSRQAYSFADEIPLPGWGYYRLKQVDTDGRFSFSRPVAVQRADDQSTTALHLWPNPASVTVRLQLDGDAPVQTARISDVRGRWFTFSADVGTLNVSGLSAGVYVVEVQTLDGRLLRQRLVIGD